ncbi:hypothetical protein, partial [Hoeflea olei]|uniref:hypothetical protein n=1 Tax=Hoeflea olei TaxID=1480615 RepID=UPI001495855C
MTDDCKKAAISAVAVMSLRPFAIVEPDDVRSNAVYFANPFYAFAVANSWLSSRNLVEHYPFDYLRRFYISLMRIRMPSLMPFIETINAGGNYRE